MIDLVLRGLVAALLVVLGARLFLAHRAQVAAKLGIALCAGMVAYLSVPYVVASKPRGASSLVVLVAASSNPKLIWLMSMALFRDGYHLRRHHVAIAAGALAVGLLFVYRVPILIAGDSEIVRITSAFIPKAITLVFLGLAILESQRGTADDLVEPRRRVRRVVIGVIASYAALVAVVEIALRREPAPWPLEALNLVALLVITVMVGAMVVRHGSLIFPLPSMPASSPPRNVLQEKLDTWLLGQGYLDPDLTVETLAKHLGTQEHTLRKLLNQELGFRNFRDFLNQHRINEARRRLSTPGASDLPILNLSLDLGYRSLATFNRVFKASTGMSPTAYRDKNGPPRNL